MNSLATFGLTAIVLFALAMGLAVNARAAEGSTVTKMHVLQTVTGKSEP